MICGLLLLMCIASLCCDLWWSSMCFLFPGMAQERGASGGSTRAPFQTDQTLGRTRMGTAFCSVYGFGYVYIYIYIYIYSESSGRPSWTRRGP